MEVFLDGDYSLNNGANYGFGIGAQLAITANGASHGNGADFLFGEDDEDDWFAVPSITDGGYMIEYRIYSRNISTQSIEISSASTSPLMMTTTMKPSMTAICN